MKRRPLVRSLLASAAIAATLALAGCDTDGIVEPTSGRALAPLSEKMLADIEAKNMSKESPILVRLFKEESEFEVWKQDNTGHFELLKTYPICRWSGELGPKIKEGDRQAPEGFYPITPGLMNPNSNYYLAINTGFPNAYDRANGHTGAFLMIHGDCSSSGCYAMTDEQIAEIYALARESFLGGQREFQIQAYPFRMTALNMAKHRNSPSMAFWRMIKEGNDHFEATHLEPKVDVCERHYVFDAQAPGGASTPLKFDPTGKCPAYKVPDDIAAAVKDKQQRDDAQFADLVSRGTPTVPVRMGTDGGMNPIFLAAVQAHGGTETRISSSSLPGSIPANIRPPGEPTPETTGSTMSLASADSRPAPAPGASGSLFGNLFSSSGNGGTGGEAQSGGGIFDRMSRLVGLHGSDQPAATEAPPAAKPKPATTKPTQTAAKPKPKSDIQKADTQSTEPKSAPAAPAQNAAPSQAPTQQADAVPPAAGSGNLLSGAATPVPAGSFDTRWSTMR